MDLPDYGQRVADGSVAAELHLIEDEGHLIGLTHRVEVVQHLREVVNGSSSPDDLRTGRLPRPVSWLGDRFADRRVPSNC